jgi:hypothetical protein
MGSSGGRCSRCSLSLLLSLFEGAHHPSKMLIIYVYLLSKMLTAREYARARGSNLEITSPAAVPPWRVIAVQMSFRSSIRN